MKKSFILSFIVSQTIYILMLPVIIHLFSYIHPVAFAVIWAFLTFTVTFLVLSVRNHKIVIPYYLFFIIMLMYTCALLVLLFVRPSNQNYDNWNLVPFQTIKFFISGRVPLLVEFYNLTANVILFVPYGIFLLIKKSRDGLSLFSLVFYPLTAISMIEIMQHLTHRGSLDIDDLILNMCGVFLGFAFYPLFKRVIQIKKKKTKK
ncbi:VanZ family protein [Falsibacillus albus]|uniref:VanZ family protein n=1 Tax=Falsibacillus albus TaxID=2478915 RepID=A0A3L7JU00_9BACI|nr:VanZ family protein [Falsibacillus albus]RLQ94318.1 VanZ family protein [Falsibacillus albus]